MTSTDDGGDADRRPIRMLHDRVLVRPDVVSERRSGPGIVIPATATMGRRLAWAEDLHAVAAPRVPDGGTRPYL